MKLIKVLPNTQASFLELKVFNYNEEETFKIEFDNPKKNNSINMIFISTLIIVNLEIIIIMMIIFYIRHLNSKRFWKNMQSLHENTIEKFQKY